MSTRDMDRLVRDESAATALEYGLLVALISVTLISVLSSVGTEVFTFFDVVERAVSGVT